MGRGRHGELGLGTDVKDLVAQLLLIYGCGGDGELAVPRPPPPPAVAPAKEWVWLAKQGLWGYGYRRPDGLWVVDPGSKRKDTPPGARFVEVAPPVSTTVEKRESSVQYPTAYAPPAYDCPPGMS